MERAQDCEIRISLMTTRARQQRGHVVMRAAWKQQAAVAAGSTKKCGGEVINGQC